MPRTNASVVQKDVSDARPMDWNVEALRLSEMKTKRREAAAKRQAGVADRECVEDSGSGAAAATEGDAGDERRRATTPP